MADWLKPTITSDYIQFVDELKSRDLDAISLCGIPGSPLNLQAGMIQMVRGASMYFREWNGSAWVNHTLSVLGGGTGATEPGGIRNNLGLGTMAVQNANAVAITGGSLQSISLHSNITMYGGTLTISENPGHGLVTYGPAGAGAFSAFIIGSGTPGGSQGCWIQAGYTAGDHALHVRNRVATVDGLYVSGDMVVVAPNRLVIPVGTNLWAPA